MTPHSAAAGKGGRSHLGSPFRLRASEGNLQGVLDELPAVPQSQRCLFCRPAGCYGRVPAKQAEPFALVNTV
jgi:hypothetical protein